MKLFQTVLNNGIWLLLREILNVLIRIFGIFLLLKLLTPEHYGMYVIAFSLANCISQAFNMGLNVHIVKYEDDISKVLKSFSSFSCYVALIVTISAYAFIPIFSLITRTSWVILAFSFLTIPLVILGTVPMGIIEKRMNYKKISTLEILCQIIYYIVSISLALAGMNVWAPIIGSLTMSIFYLVGLIKIANYNITIHDVSYFKELKKFGYQYSFANASYQTRSLILPLVITPLTTHTVVGTIALAYRIADSLNIFKVSLGRLSISTLAKVQQDEYRFSRVVKDAMSYQIMGVGFILLVFVAFSPIVFPVLLDKKWLDILPVIPFIAFSSLCNCLTTAQVSALYIKGKNYIVALNFIIQQVVFSICLYIFIPKLEIIGYGYALLISFPSYLFLSLSFSKLYRNFNPTTPFIWFASISVSILLGKASYLLYGTALLPLVVRSCREQIVLLLNNIHKAIKARIISIHAKK